MAFPWMAAAMIGGQLLGGAMGARSARKAAKIQAQSQREALQFQREQMERTTRMLQPYVDEGTRARNRLNALYGIGAGPDGGMVNWDQTDAYRAMNDLGGYGDSLEARTAAIAEEDGRRRMMGMAGASGQLLSGRIARGLADNRNRADLEGQYSYLNRRRGDFRDYTNYLGGSADQGFSALTGQATAGQNFANSAGNATINAGNARAQGVRDAGQAWANAIGEAAFGFGRFMGGRPPPSSSQFAMSTPARLTMYNMNMDALNRNLDQDFYRNAPFVKF